MLAECSAMSALTIEVESSRSTDPHDLTQALTRGDRAALASLYREHNQAVRGLVRRFLADEASVEDVLHDTFMAAPSAFRSYRGEGSVRAFLYTMAVHRVHNHIRSTQRRRGLLDRFAKDPGVARAPIATPADENERSQLAARLRAALAKLSFEHRVVVVLCEVEELTSPEAAQILSIPEATVRTRLHHAKKRLREILGGVDGK